MLVALLFSAASDWGLGPVAGQDLCTWAVLPAQPNWSRHHALGGLHTHERTNNCLLTLILNSGSRK